MRSDNKYFLGRENKSTFLNRWLSAKGTQLHISLFFRRQKTDLFITKLKFLPTITQIRMKLMNIVLLINWMKKYFVTSQKKIIFVYKTRNLELD